MASIQKEARDIIKENVIFSMGAGLIPIFVLDIVAITTIQMEMIRQLCRFYVVDYEEKKGKGLVTALTGTTFGRLMGYGIGSALKAIPGIGTLLGGVTLSVTAGATTYAVGQVFAHHFEHGGSIYDLDPEKFRDFYKEQMEHGKKIVKRWKKEEEKEEEPSESQEKGKAILDQLKAAEELKNSGAITEEEYEVIKESLLRKFIRKDEG
jgi:uncharacterized protein (DUF697 family)